MFRTLSSPQGGRIILDGKEVINMASNNYLGLANHPALVEAAKAAIDEYGVGAGAARTIVGNFAVHDALDRALADFKETEAACVFNSGLAANYGVIPLIVGKGDDVFSDALNHASIIDGIRLSKANVFVYQHLNMADLEEKLKASESPNKLIVTDAVFSMDGDLAPLPEIVALAKRYGARVMVDDAHGDGVLGKHGSGTVSHFGLSHDDIFVETGSLSKGLGSAGGFVAGSRELIDRVSAKSRSFIFTATPMQPAHAAAALKAIELLTESDELLNRLWENRAYFMDGMRRLGLDTGSTKTPIIPVMVGDEEIAKQFSAMLYDEGVFAQAIAFPVVPRGRARLRVMVSADHTKADLDQAIAAFEKVGKALNLI